jgi:hypothetical protein
MPENGKRIKWMEKDNYISRMGLWPMMVNKIIKKINMKI